MVDLINRYQTRSASETRASLTDARLAALFRDEEIAREGVQIMADKATKEETVELPDGRLLQVQAAGAPVNEVLAQRVRDEATAAAKVAERGHDFEITRETDVVGEGLVRSHVVHTLAEPLVATTTTTTTTKDSPKNGAPKGK